MRMLALLLMGSALACGVARPTIIPDTRYPLPVAKDIEIQVAVDVRDGEQVKTWVVPFQLRAGDYCAVRSAVIPPEKQP